jgi:hypothetical protein
VTQEKGFSEDYVFGFFGFRGAGRLYDPKQFVPNFNRFQ